MRSIIQQITKIAETLIAICRMNVKVLPLQYSVGLTIMSHKTLSLKIYYVCIRKTPKVNDPISCHILLYLGFICINNINNAKEATRTVIEEYL